MSELQKIQKFLKVLKGATPAELKMDKWDTASDIIAEVFSYGDCYRLPVVVSLIFEDPRFTVARIKGKNYTHILISCEGSFVDINHTYASLEEFVAEINKDDGEIKGAGLSADTIEVIEYNVHDYVAAYNANLDNTKTDEEFADRYCFDLRGPCY